MNILVKFHARFGEIGYPYQVDSIFVFLVIHLFY